MNVTAFAKWTGTLLLVITLGACGGSDDGAGGTGPQPAGTVIGAAGGTVTGPNGASVVIPPGALTTNTTITITQTSAGSPPLPGGFSSFGQMFAFTPHGTTFAVPVTLTVPFDPASVPAGVTPALFKTNAAMSGFDPVPGATVGASSVTAQVTSFSLLNVGSAPLEVFEPERTWEFLTFPGDEAAATRLPGPDGNGTAPVGELLDKVVPFGSTNFDVTITRSGGIVLPPDLVPNGHVFSTADGKTYGVFSEAPSGNPGTPEATGSQTRYTQRQSFKRNRGAVNPSVIFTLTTAQIVVTDFSVGQLLAGLRLQGEVEFSVKAYKTTSSDPFFHAAGSASVTKIDGVFRPAAPDKGQNHLWNLGDDFDFRATELDLDGCFGRRFTLTPKPDRFPRRFIIDLSSVLDEEEFTVESIAVATTENRQGPQSITDCLASYVSAFLRDPQEIGGTTLTFTGVEPTNRPLPPPPDQRLVPPAVCVPGPGPNPESGVLQFDAATYTINEFARAVPTVTVTRTGGSVGAVTATFSTRDGTAIGGVDYTSVSATVFFADGEAGPRVVSVPIIPDQVAEPDKTVNLTLSQPGGCAALGPQTTAVLTIRDDQLAAPPPPSFSIGGTVTGLAGTGLVLRVIGSADLTPGNGAFTFGSSLPSGTPYTVTVATQPTNPLQICAVTNGSGTVGNANITNVAVNCVTPPPSGGLDAGFGSNGKVSTAFGGDDTAMALQADGKIVMVGGSGTDFLLARYNLDGTLDTSFGAGGLVTSDVGSGSADEARGVAIQSDGKIVVVGNAVVGRTTTNQFNFDFAVARFNVDGSPDTSFGSGGKVTTDFNGQVDRAFAVAIQTDGKIVVVGSAGFSITSGISTDFAVARYNSNGTPDTSFGSSGKLTTDVGGAVDIAQNVVVQPNGVILVSGVLALGGDPTLGHGGLARYDGNGIPDMSFGSAGKLTLPNVSLGDALALQSDGRILVAGSAVVGGTFQFALMRLSASGSPDGSFGSGGLVTTGFSTQDDFGRAVAIQADGRIVVAGQSSNKSNPDFAVARYATNGAVDASFGTGGKLTIDFFGSFDGAENVAVQPDGKIVVSGFARNGTRTGYGLVRILP